MASNVADGLAAVRYALAMRIGVVVIVAIWHFGYDTIIMLRGWVVYQPRAAALGAWLVLAAVQILGSVLLLRGTLSTTAARSLAVAALAAGAAATLAYPPGQALSDVSWAWNTVGWFGVLLLMYRPPWELVVLSLANTAVTATSLIADGSLDRVTVARFVAVTYATVCVQILFMLVNGYLIREARRTTEITMAKAEQFARQAADEAVHVGRQCRYNALRDRIEPLLHGIACQRLDPVDPVVQRAAGVEAARLRRLFAETDDTQHPLLYELRACADVAERRDVDVTIISYGDLPTLSAPIRRALTEAPLHVLASATTWARLTVVADGESVVVSVVGDAPADALLGLPDNDPATAVHDEKENQLWVESRWRILPPSSMSA